MDYEASLMTLADRIIEVINELDAINKEYASWDEWDKTKIIDSSVNALKVGFRKELIERFSEAE